jgi:hypothetical protein
LVVRDAATAIERTIRLKRYRQLLQLWGEASDGARNYQEQLRIERARILALQSPQNHDK